MRWGKGVVDGFGVGGLFFLHGSVKQYWFFPMESGLEVIDAAVGNTY